MTKVTIPVEIDVEQIAKELVETDLQGTSVRWSLGASVKSEIFEQLKDWLIRQTDVKDAINTLKEKGFSGEWLKETARNTVTAEVKLLVEAYAKQWFDKQLESFIRTKLEGQMEKILLPMLQSFVSRAIVVDEKAIQEEMASMNEHLQNVAHDAYESGQMDAAKEIRNSI